MHGLRDWRRIVLGGWAVALIFSAGLAATPTGAVPREEAVKEANEFIDLCFDSGGTPEANVEGDDVIVTCQYDDGAIWGCWFQPETTCVNYPRWLEMDPRDVTSNLGLGDPLINGPTASTPAPTDGADSPRPVEPQAAPAAAGDEQPQDHQAKKGTGKHGKKGGKHRKR